MKICYIAPDVAIPFANGASVHVSEVASSLASLGHEVHVICRRVRSSDPPVEESNGVMLHRVYRWMFRAQGKSRYLETGGGGGAQPPKNTIESEGRRSPTLNRIYYAYLTTVFPFYVSIVASRIVRRFRIDAILERETSFGAGGLASLFTQKPMILEIVGPRYSRLSAWRSKRILYYTESMLRGWVDRTKCVAVPGGVNLSSFRPDEEARQRVRHQLDFETGNAVVGYVGSFLDWHGIDSLLIAAATLHKKNPNLRVLLVGPKYESYQELAMKLGLEGTCRFVGAVAYNEVSDYINACELMVAPYDPSRDPLRKQYGIGWPLKILEYMACERPVIATRVPPIDRIISGPDLGVLVDPGATDQLAEAIGDLISDAERMKKLGTNGAALVRAHYSWGALASDVSSIVESAA